MVDYKEILKLSSKGYSLRQIAASVGHSYHAVKNVLNLAAKHKVEWPVDEDVTNAELEKLFYPDRKDAGKFYANINFEYIHRELSKKGVTLTLLWQEYCEKAYTNGEMPYMSTQFGDKYRRWARVTKATMRVTHKPGDTMQAIGQVAQSHISIRLPVKSTRRICLLLRCRAVTTSTLKPAPT